MAMNSIVMWFYFSIRSIQEFDCLVKEIDFEKVEASE